MTYLIDPYCFSLLEKYFPTVIYKNEEIVIYRSHIPRVGLILVEGEMELIKTKTSSNIEKNHGVGLRDLWNKTPSKFKIKVFPGTKVLSLDFSTLKTLIDDKVVKLDFLETS